MTKSTNVFRREDGGWKVHAVAVSGDALTAALRPERHGAVLLTLDADEERWGNASSADRWRRAQEHAAEQAATMNRAIEDELMRTRREILRGRSIASMTPPIKDGVAELLKEAGGIHPLDAVDTALKRLRQSEKPTSSS